MNINKELRYKLAPQMKVYDSLGYRFLPYIMFTQPPNFRSEVLNTDERGFRFNSKVTKKSIFGEIKKNETILFLGGSTAFGVGSTKDENSITGILEKKSKLRYFFETNKKTICVPCYLDSQKDLEIIAKSELRKSNISLSSEALNLLIEKSNSDRGNLKNEIEKIKAYLLNKTNIELSEIKSLINFSGDYKSDILVNECLCGNISQYKKIISELYINTVNQILLLRILSNKIHRLIKIKTNKSKSSNEDNLINSIKPSIFWKERPLVKKQLSIWELNDLIKMIKEINNTELLCKKNPQISNSIFFNFFTEICKKANNFS